MLNISLEFPNIHVKIVVKRKEQEKRNKEKDISIRNYSLQFLFSRLKVLLFFSLEMFEYLRTNEKLRTCEIKMRRIIKRMAQQKKEEMGGGKVKWLQVRRGNSRNSWL